MNTAETVSTSFRTSKDKINQLDAIASSMGRSRNWLLNKALDDVLEHQAWFVAEVQKGIKAADNGGFVSPEEVTAIFNKYGA